LAKQIEFALGMRGHPSEVAPAEAGESSSQKQPVKPLALAGYLSDSQGPSPFWISQFNFTWKQ